MLSHLALLKAFAVLHHSVTGLEAPHRRDDYCSATSKHLIRRKRLLHRDWTLLRHVAQPTCKLDDGGSCDACVGVREDERLEELLEALANLPSVCKASQRSLSL